MTEAAPLLLLLAANGAPVLARWALGSRWARPVDGGRTWRDGRPLLGAAKTWRGVAAGGLLPALLAPLLGLPAVLGLALGLLSMAGDLGASFLKRRLGLPPSARATGLDQLPEACLPLAVLRVPLSLDWADVLGLGLAFMLLDLLLSPLLYRLHIRRRPY